MIKIGIIDAGVISEKQQLPGFQDCSDAQVTALTDINKKRAERLAGRFGIKNVYAD
jgi:predicted dehydrogenase